MTHTLKNDIILYNLYYIPKTMVTIKGQYPIINILKYDIKLMGHDHIC